MKYLLLTVVLLATSGAFARDLSLEDAMALAEAHSYELKASRATAASAEAALGSARSERWPRLTANGTYSYISDVPSLDIQIPSLPPLSREIGVHDNYQADLRVSVPLFTGGRIGGGVDAASASAEYSRALVAADLDKLYLLTRLEYLWLYRADRTVDAAEASLRRADLLMTDVNSAYQAGVADSVDLLEASLTQSNARFGLQHAENERRSAEIRLAVLLGLPADEPLTLTSTFDAPALPALTGQLADDKPELQATQALIDVNKARVKLAGADYFPVVSVFGGYSYGKPNLDRFNNTWNDYFTVGASLNWSFDLGGRAGHDKRKAQHELESGRQQYNSVRESLDREVRLAVEQVKLAYDRYETAKRESEIADNNYRLARNKREAGSLTTNHLLDIEANLSRAQASLAAAEADYYVALSGYYYALGSPSLKEGR
jgi:outer membrane protein